MLRFCDYRLEPAVIIHAVRRRTLICYPISLELLTGLCPRTSHQGAHDVYYWMLASNSRHHVCAFHTASDARLLIVSIVTWHTTSARYTMISYIAYSERHTIGWRSITRC